MFSNRKEAGQLLAAKLGAYKNAAAVVLAIPRGGIPVAYEIARSLNLPLDIIQTKKIGHPLHKEYAIGAVSPDSYYIDRENGVSDEYIQSEIKRIRKEMEERSDVYLGGRAPVPVKDQTAIIVDDGIATGSTVLAAIKLLRSKQVPKIVVAVPVAPAHNKKIKLAADEYICLLSPANFVSVGYFYEDFSDVTDSEATEMLQDKIFDRFHDA